MWYINGQKDEGLRSAHVHVPPGDLFAQTMLQVYRAYEIACERSGNGGLCGVAAASARVVAEEPAGIAALPGAVSADIGRRVSGY